MLAKCQVFGRILDGGAVVAGYKPTQVTPARSAQRGADSLTPRATARAQSNARARRAARWKLARARERETRRSKAGKGSRMRGSAIRARQDGEREVEFPRGNLTR